MKRYNLLLALTVLAVGTYLQSVAQDIKELPEVTVVAKNYKYLRSVDYRETAQPVQLLERSAAAYDIRNSEYYQDDYDNYFINFYLPQGYILAEYDKDGKLVRTAERFKDVALPPIVRNAVMQKYPQWRITKDVYVVKYGDAADARKEYKMILENGSKRLRVKTNANGDFL